MGDFAMMGNCGENPLDGFISNADKSTGFDAWQQDFHAFDAQQNNRPFLPHGFQEGFLNEDFTDFGGDKFHDLDQIWDGIPRPFEPHLGMEEFELKQVNPIVNNVLRNFLHLSANEKLLPRQKSINDSELRLSNEDVDKIIERSGKLARHFCISQSHFDLMCQQLSHLFITLNINMDPRPLLDNCITFNGWDKEYENFREPIMNHGNQHFQQFDRVWNQRMGNMHSDQWRSEYLTNIDNLRVPEISKHEQEMMNKTYSEVESVQDWVNEYNKDQEDERAEEEAWFAKFVSQPQQSKSSGNSWVDEYNRGEFVKDKWVEEYKDKEFEKLSDSVSEIPHQKLKDSNFLKFVNQVRNKEVVLPDLQMKVMED